ncbi:MAG: spore coat protein [Acutalibacteraceae bacterium]
MNEQLPMNDKEMMDDTLSSQKSITELYNQFANECATESIRSTMMSILKEEHDMQADVFSEMQKRGWYQVPPAEQQKIDSAKQKFMKQSAQ